MNNERLAYFINSFGSMNDYAATLSETKLALDSESANSLKSQNDQGLFIDALAGIDAAKQKGFSVDAIVAVNESFTHNPEEDPGWPGHLRNGYYNEEDRISILTGYSFDQDRQKVEETYFPPAIVTREMVQKTVDQYNNSPQEQLDAWRVFAQLAKMQAFQDGNKRTALIAANAAAATFESQNYLALPLNYLDNALFTIRLPRKLKS